MAWPLARSVCSSEPRRPAAACPHLLMLTASRSPSVILSLLQRLSYRLQPRARHGVCRYAGLVTCTGLRKEGDKLVEVHGEFQPLKAGQKLPKAKLRHPVVLCALFGKRVIMS